MTIGVTAFVLLMVLALAAGLVAGLGYRRRPEAEPDPRRGPDYLAGIHALIDGRDEAALRHLTRAAQRDSGLLEVYLALGRLYRGKGFIDRAVQLHESLLSRVDLSDEERFIALLALGRDFKAGGFLDRAIRCHEEAVAIRPKSDLALRRLARLHAAAGDWPAALATESRRKRRDREPAALAHYHAALAEAAERAGDHKTASDHFARARRLHPRAAAAWLGLARAARRTGKPEAARGFLEKYATRFPERGVVVLPALRELCDTPARASAWEWQAQRLAKEAGSARAALLLAEHWLEAGKIAEAAELAEQMVRRRPRLGPAHRVWNKLAAAGALAPERLRTVAAALAADERLQAAWSCVKCAYESGEPLPRCPSCKAWDSFNESQA